MIRDPFYRDIEEGLGGTLSPELFERCAASLLREIYPGLVPVRGGGDAGMDGAVADGVGPPFPLVTTTGSNVLANLRRSLTSYRTSGGKRTTVIFATSQALTPRRRRNLEAAAQRLGFTLAQIYDRPAIADLLYRNPEWCRELLNLVGSPPPLSVLSLPGRPAVGDSLIGRGDDMAWLKDTPGDLLLVGQPGSGKTFLLQRFAKENEGLFVHSADLALVAGEIRRQQPAFLLIDDAHVQLDLIAQLRRMRTEMSAGFRLVATSWPGSQAEVAHALGVRSASIRTLELLSRDEIAELVKSAGIGGPPGLIQEIVNQAEGKPGLAATLMYLSLRGDIRSLAQGDALSAEVVRVFRNLVGSDVSAVLASFAVGGDGGMTMQAVAEYLREQLHSLRERTAKLAAGGVLVEINRERLAVRPPALRHVLVRDVFFGGATALPIEPVLLGARIGDDVALTLIGAQYRGAQVPADLLRRLLESSSSSQVWTNYAGLGREEAEWIADEHGEWMTRIGTAALEVAPDRALAPLLEAGIGDSRALHSTPAHPLRIVSDWVCSAYPGSPAVVERRHRVLRAAETWLEGGGDQAVGLHALALALSPIYSNTESNPGSGRTITFSRGLVSRKDMQAIRGFWPSVRDKVSRSARTHWGPLKEAVVAWAYPRTGHQDVSKQLEEEAQGFAAEMLQDLVGIAQNSLGIVHWARQIADQVGIELTVVVDPVFDVLYPVRELDDWRRAEEEQRARADALATTFLSQLPSTVVQQLLKCEQEARLMGHAWPRWTPYVCQELARRTNDAEPFFRNMIEGGASADLVQPFLHRLLRENLERGAVGAGECLASEPQRLATVATIFTTDGITDELVELALGSMSGGSKLAEVLCLRNEVPERILRRLLRHADATIAVAAAQGEWLADPRGQVRATVRQDWEQAILRASGDEWPLKDILVAEPTLAFEWLRRRIADGDSLWRHDDTIAGVMQGLGQEQRREILRIIPESLYPPDVLKQVIGNDLDLFHELLATERLKRVHLAPFAGHPNPRDWAEKAKVALAVGYSPEDIAEAAFGHGWSWSGSEAGMWGEWATRFEALRAHEDRGVREIGVVGARIATDRQERAAEREREEEIRGF